MPSMDDVYGTAPPLGPVPVKPAVATPSPAVLIAEPVTALERFTGNIGTTLKADALAVLQIKVVVPDSLERAGKLSDLRAQAKALLKNIEERRKAAVGPLNAEVAAVNAEAHRWADPVQAWDKDAERALLAFQHAEADRVRREREAEAKRITEAAQRQSEAEAKGDEAAAQAASMEIATIEAKPNLPPMTGYKTDAGTAFIKKRWRVEVVDPALVPPAYLVPDLHKLQAAVDAGARDIEGCNISEEESLQVRTR